MSALSTAYASDYDAQEGAITHCDAQNVDVPWADYYLLEALRRMGARTADPAHPGRAKHAADPPA